MSKRVIVIGAGIGGLATANMLAKAGYEVAVYEKNSHPGGKAGRLNVDGFSFDTGPSWYLMPKVFEHYFSLFGRSAQKELDLQKLSPAYKVFYETTEPIVITGNSKLDMQTFEAIEAGAGKKLASYIRRGNKIYELSLRHFLYTNFTSLRDFISRDVLKNSLSMLRLAFMPIDKYVGKFVSNARLQKILEYPMVFLGSSPFSAPAIYSLMSALDFEEGVFYPKGGMYSIIERLVAIGKELDVTYHYNAEVARIAVKDGAASGIELAGGTQAEADIVVSDADLHFTETKLLPPQLQSYPQSYWDKREAGPSALLLYLGVRGELPELEHHNLFFVDAWERNFHDIFIKKDVPFPASLYICKPSAIDTTVAPKDHENVFVLVPLPAGVAIDDTHLETLADDFIAYIETKLSLKAFAKRVVVKEMMGPNDFSDKFNAWEGSALGPSHILKQSAMFRTPNVSKKVKNLYYVGGSTTPGIGLPMCLIGAELVYKRLAKDKRGGPIAGIKTLVGNDD